jgi:hypothetical protein
LSVWKAPTLSRRSPTTSCCTEFLHLSEAEAYLRIAAARASREHPLLLTMLAGFLTLGDDARQKVLSKSRRLREELGQAPRLARAP